MGQPPSLGTFDANQAEQMLRDCGNGVDRESAAMDVETATHDDAGANSADHLAIRHGEDAGGRASLQVPVEMGPDAAKEAIYRQSGVEQQASDVGAEREQHECLPGGTGHDLGRTGRTSRDGLQYPGVLGQQ